MRRRLSTDRAMASAGILLPLFTGLCIPCIQLNTQCIAELGHCDRSPPAAGTSTIFDKARS